MEITINATPKEIAALVVGLQERRGDDDLSEAVMKRVHEAVVNAAPVMAGPPRAKQGGASGATV